MKTRVLSAAVLALAVAGGLAVLPTPLRAHQETPWPRVAPFAIPQDRPLRAGFLIVDGVYNSELMAPYDIFHHTVFHAQPGMEVFTVSPDGKPVTTFEGLTVAAHYSFADVPAIDILVVPSAEGSMTTDLEDPALMAWVAKVGASATYVMSLCDGAFVLAAAGLLDGAAVTTFPGDQDRFAEAFPALDLRREISFVHDGRLLTSQGGARSYDVALYLVDHLYGTAAATGVAAGLVIPWPPTAATMPATVIDR
jgi:transcriptional regulator GlxA family with amidase domain